MKYKYSRTQIKTIKMVPKKINLLLLAFIFAFVSCNHNTKSGAGDAAFDKLAEEYLKGY